MIVDLIARTISWSVGIDLDPDVLHGDQPAASGPGSKVLREYHAKSALTPAGGVGRGGTKCRNGR